ADIGAGPGVLSIPIAKAVAPRGKVYAVEIDQPFLDHIAKRAEEQHVTNITGVLGKPVDPNLPARDVDVALFHDVLHHIADRAGYLKAIAQYVKAGGRVAIIELPPNGAHKDEPALVVTKDQANSWMADAGFRPAQEFDGLAEGKWFIVYGRPSLLQPRPRARRDPLRPASLFARRCRASARPSRDWIWLTCCSISLYARSSSRLLMA